MSRPTEDDDARERAIDLAGDVAGARRELVTIREEMTAIREQLRALLDVARAIATAVR